MQNGFTKKSFSELDKLTTPRLLAYYRARRNAVISDVNYPIEYPEKYEADRTYLNAIKALLDMREHVSKII